MGERRTSPILAQPTARQLEVLRVVQRETAAKGFSPTIRELCDLLGITSTNAMADALWSLRRRSLLTWEEHRARTFVITDAGKALLAAEKRRVA
jgi:repressor LexA